MIYDIQTKTTILGGRKDFELPLENIPELPFEMLRNQVVVDFKMEFPVGIWVLDLDENIVDRHLTFLVKWREQAKGLWGKVITMHSVVTDDLHSSWKDRPDYSGFCSEATGDVRMFFDEKESADSFVKHFLLYQKLAS